MSESFVEGLLRKLVPQLEQSLCPASVERVALWMCTWCWRE